MKNLISIIAVLLLIAIGPIHAQTFNAAREDSLLNLLAEKNRAMGNLAVLENGKVVYTKAIGFSESTPKIIPSDPNTKYRIGSISKMFTAVLIFQLIDEGKLELTRTLDKFFPSIPNSEKITVADMLSHRSGIHNFTNDSLYTTYQNRSMSKPEMIDIIAATKPEFNPDEKTAYSNSNFVLLGYIVEELYQKPYNDILQENICKKAGLVNTYYGGKTDVLKNECYSFRYNTSWEKLPETDMSIPHGAGSIVSTASDLVTFIYALFNGVLVSSESMEHMMNIREGLGMGMMQFPYEDKKVYGHGGAIDGFNSLLCYMPDEKVAFSYISNGTYFSVNNILLRTMNNYFGKYEKLPEFVTYAVNSENLNQYTGKYSSKDIPIKVSVFIKDGHLYGQGEGQPEILLEATGKDTFKFEPAGIVMIFHPAQNEFILEQGGGNFTFIRE